jgi:hypothetical protein
MSKKFILLTSFVLVLALAGTNVVSAAIVAEWQATDTQEDYMAYGGLTDNGTDDGGSSDLEMPWEGEANASNYQVICLRFVDIQIPEGAEITSANVQFTGDNEKLTGGPVNLIINGLLQLNPGTFGGNEDIYTVREPKTTAEVKWSDIPDWGSGSATPASRTPDISSVIQEIMAQEGWASGNDLVLFVRDDETNPSADNRSALSSSPLLQIEYTVPYARDPNPADGGTGGPAPLLQWTKGYTAVYHDVYFGTNPDLGPADLMDRMPFTMYWHIPGLTPGTTYYWRIDEVEADGTTTYTGNVWSFLAAPFIAYNPDPPNGSKTAIPDAPFSWGSGATAATHDVYLGANRADVAAGTADTFKGNQIDQTYRPEGLENGTAYYWRIDEIEADGTTKYPGEVWSFKTMDDPAFIGWWKFDEGQGNIAYDSSGYGNHGIVQGNLLWVTNGAIDGALELDGSDDFVAIDGVAEYMINNNFTVSAWIKTEQEDDGNVFASNFGGSHDFIFGVDMGNVMVEDSTQTTFPPKINNDRWHMITYVRDGAEAWIYVDGVLRGTDDADDDPAGDDLWSIGQEWDSSPSDEYEGMVDDARFWIRPLSAEEVAEVFKGDVELAHSPMPANNSTPDVGQVPPLSWSPGENASQHDVYFGTDELSLGGADASDTTGMYRGRQSATSYTPTEPLEWGSGPYYWRIDEYNTDATISTGKVWSFTVADYLLVDDFEDYNDYPPDEIWSTWTDGYGTTTNGSTIGYPDPDWNAGEHYVETSIVHGGAQAMPYFYDNDSKFSEASRSLVSVRDWTQEGVGVLSLWFYGDEDNDAEQMYVALNGSVIVNHDNPNAAQIGTWTEWTIDLQEFAAQGVNLANVNTITIGFGDKNNLQAGGEGLVFFDDIRLYRPAP